MKIKNILLYIHQLPQNLIEKKWADNLGGVNRFND